MSKSEARAKRKIRIRKKISGFEARPRLVVYRSNLHIYAQLIDDTKGQTVVATSTLSIGKADQNLSANLSGATRVGQEIAKLAKEKDIHKVVFDRNGYLYHGRVKAVADGAREAGLEF